MLVRSFHEGFPRIPWIDYCAPHRHGHSYQPAVHVECRLINETPEFLGSPCQGFLRDAEENRHELVAAPTSYNIRGTNTIGKCLSNTDQRSITDGMPVGVVWANDQIMSRNS